MAGSYVEKAVSLIQAAYVANLAGELTTVETEQSLTAGSLEVPVEFLDYFAPGDNRSPLVSIFEDTNVTVDQPGGRVYNIPITVVLGYLGDGQLSANANAVRQYMTAMIRAITEKSNYDALLASGILAAGFAGFSSREQSGDQSFTRHTSAIGWSVLVDESEC